MKYKIIFLLYLLLLALCFEPTKTYASNSTPSVEFLEDGYYFETIIEDVTTTRGAVPNIPENYITKVKTTNFKDSAGNTIWSVSITATFFYDGTTSRCTTCTPSATAYGETWKIKSVTSSKSGNSATATAIAIRTGSTGTTQTVTKSVTISCSPAGVVS